MEIIDDVATVTKCGIEAIEKNAYVVSQFEIKRLKLNEIKMSKYTYEKMRKNVL